jgi:hypothetical protein
MADHGKLLALIANTFKKIGFWMITHEPPFWLTLLVALAALVVSIVKIVV